MRCAVVFELVDYFGGGFVVGLVLDGWVIG